MNNVYVGNRYVPVFASPVEWDNLRSYEPLTIVTYQGASYTSKKIVPVGTALNNQEYWVVTGNYNQQVEQYRTEVVHLSEVVGDSNSGVVKQVNTNTSDISVLKNKVEQANLEINQISDKVDSNTEIITGVKKNLDLEIYGILAPTSSGWVILNDENHKSKNIQSVAIENGILKITHNVGATKVGFLQVTPDESFCDYGVVCGSSVGKDYSFIKMNCNPNIGGLATGTGTTANWINNFSNNLSALSWNGECFICDLSTELKALTTLIGFSVTAGRNSPYIYKCSLSGSQLQIFAVDSVTGNTIIPTGNITFSVVASVYSRLNPQKIIENVSTLSGFNLWVYGKMAE